MLVSPVVVAVDDPALRAGDSRAYRLDRAGASKREQG